MGTSQVDDRFYLTKASNKFATSKASNKFTLTMVKPDLPGSNGIGQWIIENNFTVV